MRQSAGVLIEARQNMPDPLVDLVVQVVYGFDLSVGFFLELQLFVRDMLRRSMIAVDLIGLHSKNGRLFPPLL